MPVSPRNPALDVTYSRMTDRELIDNCARVLHTDRLALLTGLEEIDRRQIQPRPFIINWSAYHGSIDKDKDWTTDELKALLRIAQGRWQDLFDIYGLDLHAWAADDYDTSQMYRVRCRLMEKLK